MQNLSLFESNSQHFTVDNHLSFDLDNCANLNLTTFPSITEVKSYSAIAGCVLEHILTTNSLTNYEKLYYLLSDSLSLISYNKGKARTYALPSEDWAVRLGCSRSLVFVMQKSLVKKGYFIINKDWNEIGLNNRNLITPTLPLSVFNHLNEKYPNRARVREGLEDHASYNPSTECRRSYLDRTKLYIKLNYDLLKIITSYEYINPMQKIILLGFYTRCYKNYILQSKENYSVAKYKHNDDSSFSFVTSYRELADLYSCNTKHLSKSIRALEELGFIKTQNIYVRKKYSDNDSDNNNTGFKNNSNNIQERQDQSLWKITLSLPESCILELEKVENRSNLKINDAELSLNDSAIDPRLIKDYLVLGGTKFNLNFEQVSLLKSVIVGDDNGNVTSSLLQTSCNASYIDSVMEEWDRDADTSAVVAEGEGGIGNIEDKLEESIALEDAMSLHDISDAPQISPLLDVFDNLDNKNDISNGIKSDPHVAKSGLLYNKDIILNNKDIKSNLEERSRVLFNDFFKNFMEIENEKKDLEKKNRLNKTKEKDFNIYTALIREKLKQLPKDKADKARKFAYSLVSKGLASGYAASLSKHELAKQIIHHAASWKPTKLGNISRECEIDTALSVAWKKIVRGTWKAPLELAKAEVLQHEFNAYREKYQKSGTLSRDAKSLESDVNNLLGGWCDLEEKITKGVNVSSVRELDIFANGSLELGLEERGDKNNHYLQQNPRSDSAFASSFVNDNGSHQFYYDYPETPERSNFTNISLSHIPEEQKYLKMIPSDQDDSLKLETIGGKEYLVKLRELEKNDEGEFVMTIRLIHQEVFLESNQNTVFFDKNSDNLITNNVAINDLNNQKEILCQEQLSQQGFATIDKALSSVLNNLQHKVKKG